MGARASAVMNEVSYSLFSKHKKQTKTVHGQNSNLVVPTKVAIQNGAAANGVSRSSALNPYSTRNGKGLPIFTEERLKEKQQKVNMSKYIWYTAKTSSDQFL